MSRHRHGVGKSRSTPQITREIIGDPTVSYRVLNSTRESEGNRDYDSGGSGDSDDNSGYGIIVLLLFFVISIILFLFAGDGYYHQRKEKTNERSKIEKTLTNFWDIKNVDYKHDSSSLDLGKYKHYHDPVKKIGYLRGHYNRTFHPPTSLDYYIEYSLEDGNIISIYFYYGRPLPEDGNYYIEKYLVDFDFSSKKLRINELYDYKSFLKKDKKNFYISPYKIKESIYCETKISDRVY